MTHAELDAYLLKKPDAWLDYPFGEKIAVYKAGKGEEAKMFAILREESTPIHLSLKCDPQLAELLRERYESVMPGYHLNKKHWNTLVLTGQLNDDEVRDLIDHSYQLVTGTGSAVPVLS